MVTAASWGAALLYLIPVALVLWARARRDRAAAAMALDIPLALAADFMIVLVLALFVRLEIATLASRALWIALGGALLARRRGGLAAPRWPRALRWGGALLVAAAVIAAVLISMEISRPYSAWDRKWHTPLVSSLRGQILPFRNIWNPAEVLHYHFSGDVHAAMLQTLSFGVIHSSFALSLSHDLMFGLAGGALALVLRGAGMRPAPAVILTVMGVLLSGPLTIGREAHGNAVEGYNFLNFLSMSCRPHDAVAAPFFVGFVGAVIPRALGRGRLPPAETITGLVASTVGLAISDETSIGLLGLALGIAWLVNPDVIHPRRGPGAAVLVLLLLALVAPNLAFSASLSPGAQSHHLALVSWRSPGCYMPTLPLSSHEGRRVLAYDLLPTAALWLGGTLAWLSTRSRRPFGLLVLFTALLAISVFCLTRVDVNRTPTESHRFMTGAEFLAPLLGAALIVRHRPASGDPPGSAAVRALAAALVLGGAGLGAAATYTWIFDLMPRKGHRHTHYFTNEDLYAIDCRSDLGAGAGSPPQHTYLSKSIWYAAAGCHPVFAPAQHANRQWELTIGNPLFEAEAVRELDRRLPPGEPLPVICPRDAGAGRDPVCKYARARAPCQDLGARLVRCELSGDTRKDVFR